MVKNNVEICDVTKWAAKTGLQTLGSRSKIVLENPGNGRHYFFKENKAYYPTEFWSEIIASRLAQAWGLPTVIYHVGIKNGVVGSLCELMTAEDYSLEHGQEILLREKKDFEIKKGSDHSVELVVKVLKEYNEDFIPLFLEFLVFDALIGNRDRHQENWGVLSKISLKTHNNKEPFWAKLWHDEEVRREKYGVKISIERDFKFTPLFDSGSSLGRELGDNKLLNYVVNDNLIWGYINNSRSIAHIRWKNEQWKHTELLKIIDDNFPEYKMNKIVKKILNKIKVSEVEHIVNNIDGNFPQGYDQNNLTLNRKKFIIKSVCFRAEQLKNIF